MPQRKRGKPPARNTYRIIGGRWRGRRLMFPPLEAVRPSPDRVRETLFNWLAPMIEGARCLDLFAGSGALGVEALSRGAHSVVFVERERRLVEAIRGHVADLQFSAQATCLHADAFTALPGLAGPFDLVFVDPPFAQAMVAPTLAALPGCLSRYHRVYVEREAEADPVLNNTWEVLRQRRAGQVFYQLLVSVNRLQAGPEETA